MVPSQEFQAAQLRESFKWTMAFGICLAIVGVIALAVPVVFSNLAAWVIGVFLLLGGAMRGVDVVRGKGQTATFARVVTSILYTVVGAMILFSKNGVFGLTLIVGLLFLFEAAGYLMMAVIAYPISGWYWGIINGGVTGALGGLILAGWPASGNWAIGMLVGVNLIIGGLSIVGVARRARAVIGDAMPSIVTMH